MNNMTAEEINIAVSAIEPALKELSSRNKGDPFKCLVSSTLMLILKIQLYMIGEIQRLSPKIVLPGEN